MPTRPRSNHQLYKVVPLRQPGSHRSERISTLVREAIADALASEVSDPRVGFVTVTSVEVTRDLSLARVRISVMGDDEEKQKALEGVNSARGFIRSILARTLELRTVPELRFEMDSSLAHAARVDQILSSLRSEESQTD